MTLLPFLNPFQKISSFSTIFRFFWIFVWIQILFVIFIYFDFQTPIKLSKKLFFSNRILCVTKLNGCTRSAHTALPHWDQRLQRLGCMVSTFNFYIHFLILYLFRNLLISDSELFEMLRETNTISFRWQIFKWPQWCFQRLRFVRLLSAVRGLYDSWTM